jgi:hypothetical protein
MKLLYIAFFSNFAENLSKVNLRISILTGLFFLFATYLSAQHKPIVIGVGINPGISWIKPENNFYSSEGSSFSYSYGVDLDFYFSKNYAFSTGLQIQNYKGKIIHPDLLSPSGNEDDWENVNSNSTYSYMAFHVPTYLKLKTNPIGYNSYFAEFGLSFLFPIKADQETTSTTATGQEVDRGDENVMSSTNFASANLLLGVGIELPISGETRIQIAFRFLNGISSLSNANAFKTDEFGNVSSDEITNGGQPTGNNQSYYLKNLSLNFKIVF